MKKNARFLSLVGMLLLAACGDGPTETTPLPDLTVAVVEVDPPTAYLTVGETRRLIAYPKNAKGHILADVEVTWSIGTSDKATLAADGPRVDVTALGPGPLTVLAQAGGRTGQAALELAYGPAASLVLDVESLALAEGAQHQFQATARDQHGNVITGRAVVWSSSDQSRGYVDALGKLSAIRVGPVTISARMDGQTASATVQVTASYPYDLMYAAGWSEPGGAYPMRIQRLDINAADALPSSPLPDDMDASGPTPSPDGNRIAFIRGTGNGPYRISVVNSDGTGLTDLFTTSWPVCGDLSWSPDGQQLALACRPDEPSNFDYDIWVMDADGAHRVNLTEEVAGRQYGPSWSPELPGGGSRIAYAQEIGGLPTIWTIKPDGTDRVQLTTEGDDEPAWSPDGGTIAFRRAAAALWLMSPNGENQRPLMFFDPVGQQSAPAWSPDGLLIAFTSDHETYGTGTGYYQIYTVWAADGSKIARRTTGDTHKYPPAWITR